MSRKSKGDAGRRRGDMSAPPSQAATIVVPLDGSVHALVALPVAKTLGALTGATLHVVHFGAPALPPRALLQRLGLPPEQLRGAIVDQATEAPAAGIVRHAYEWHSLLVVMCAHTGEVTSTGGLGPVAEEVLRSAPCPVVLVRPERGLEPWSPRRILLPHDGTPTMAGAIGPAADLSGRAGAELMVLHVAPSEAKRPTEPGTFAGPRYVDQPQHEYPAWAREFLGRLCALCCPPTAVRMRLFLATGDPAAEIVRFAAEQHADLIVLGWRGRLDAEHADTVKALIGQAPCPALIVRVWAHPAGLLELEQKGGAT